MGLFTKRQMSGRYYNTIGWGRVGYVSEPLNTHPNDQYTARPMGGPFNNTWQGLQQRQEERYLDTTKNQTGSPYYNSYQTAQSKQGRFQQYGSQGQYAGNYGIVPSTQIMMSPQLNPPPNTLTQSLVTAVKKAWAGASNG